MAIQRDTFTMPASDIDLLKKIKSRCLKLGIETNKSLLVRAGLHNLSNLNDKQLKEMIDSIPKIKTGRPKENK